MKKPRHAEDTYNLSEIEGSNPCIKFLNSQDLPDLSPAAAACSAFAMTLPLRPRRGKREAAALEARGQTYPSRTAASPVFATPAVVYDAMKPVSATSPVDKMGGLPLPDVVRELLKEPSVLRWALKPVCASTGRKRSCSS